MRTGICVFLGSVLLVSAALADDNAVQKKHKSNDAMSADMREAIAFQRAKDRADARQAAIEAKHPTVFYNQAERSADENEPQGKPVKDPGPGVKK